MGTSCAKMVKLSFQFLTSWHSDVQPRASECPDVKNYKRRLNPVWHCVHMATVGVKGLTPHYFQGFRSRF